MGGLGSGSGYAFCSIEKTIVDSGENLCMVIPTIKRRDLGGYKEIITCESCSYMDPKYPHP